MSLFRCLRNNCLVYLLLLGVVLKQAKAFTCCRPDEDHRLILTLAQTSSSNDGKNGNDEDNDDIYSSVLSQRIQELREKELQQAESFSQGLSGRVKELEISQQVQLALADKTEQYLELPVLSFDALLPGQSLEGRTEDPTFCQFLGSLGLGGWFVMTSTSPQARKQRRHGVLAKIQAVDYANSQNNGDSSRVKKTRIPTAVDFEIVGHSRCRIVGPRENMQQRIGRWRRQYDPNGEESVLGWGMERFLDAAEALQLKEKDEESLMIIGQQQQQNTEWSSVVVDVQLDSTETTSVDYKDWKQKIENTFIPMVDEWYQLASSADTYKNVNVTASTRIRKGHPGLWVDSKALLNRALKQLGPRPSSDDPLAFCFWAAAVINPLPPLGVSLEIRGQMLEAPTMQRRMEILAIGLRRSIDNLKGTRPL